MKITPPLRPSTTSPGIAITCPIRAVPLMLTIVEFSSLPDLDDPVMAHVKAAFVRDEVLWAVFDMKSLAETASFKHVAA